MNALTGNWNLKAEPGCRSRHASTDVMSQVAPLPPCRICPSPQHPLGFNDQPQLNKLDFFPVLFIYLFGKFEQAKDLFLQIWIPSEKYG